MDNKVRVQYYDKLGNFSLETNYLGFKEAMEAIWEKFWVARTEEKIKLKDYLKRVKIQIVLVQG